MQQTKTNGLKVILAAITLPLGGIFAQAMEPQMIEIPHGQLHRENQTSLTIKPWRLADKELTWREYSAVRAWAVKHGYDLGPGNAQGPDFPASTLSWYDAVKFCNAASELAGRTPVYYTSPKQDRVYRQGELGLTEDCVKADADGYRLPTEWEWEYACRAGTSTPYWYGEFSNANSENPYAWHTIHDARGDNVSPHPVGLKKPNPFGLYDMHGNVAEWTWNRYWDKADWRVQRGGSVALDNDITADFRSPVPPAYRIYDVGMRLASSAANCPALATVIESKKLLLPQEIPVLKPRYDHTDPAAVAAELVGLLDPLDPVVQPVIKLQAAGNPQQALETYRDILVGHMQNIKGIKFIQNKELKDAQTIAKWLAEQELFTGTAKTVFDNLDNAGRAATNSYYVPHTWDWGVGFGIHGEPWLNDIGQIATNPPAGTVSRELLPARAVANMVIFIATNGIVRPLKDPRNLTGNQQIHSAKAVVSVARIMPGLRDAGAWEVLGIERLRTGSIARFILPDGGDLEQSFNYNGGLFKTYEEIATLFDGQERPAWVDQLFQGGLRRKRLFNSLRLASGAMPSVGNNNYGRDMRENNPPSDTFHDPLTAQILDTMLYKNKEKLGQPGYTSIAFPYSGYYMMRNGWAPDSSSLFFKSSRPGAGHNHPDNNAIDLAAYGRHLLVDRESPPYQVGHLPENQKMDMLWVNEYKREEAQWASNNLLIDGCGQIPGVKNTGYQTTIPNQPWHTSKSFDFVQGHWTRWFENSKPMNAEEVRLHAKQYGATDEQIAAQLAAVEKHNSVPHKKFEATHTRQVIYLRPVNAWIVTDWANREDGETPREITQLWHLPAPDLKPSRSYADKDSNQSPLGPGFRKEHVTTDAQAQHALTANPDNVNLAILHAVPGNVKYTTYFGDKYPWRGWANAAPSMVSGYVPAVDLYAAFPADAPIVTVLLPIPQGKQLEQRIGEFTKDYANGRTRIKLAFTDGTDVEYVVSKEVAELTVGSVISKAESLLVMSKDGKTEGLSVSRAGDSFAFTVADGTLHRTSDIIAPSGFSWQERPEGLLPAYTEGKR